MLHRIYRTFSGQILPTNVQFKPRWSNHCVYLRTKLKELCLIRNIASTTSGKNKHIVNSPYKAISIPHVNLPELIWSKIGNHPNHIAMECGLTGRNYTYTQLHKLSLKFAVSLLKAGLKPGQTVLIITPNCPEHPILYLGALEAGLTITPINNNYTAEEIYFQLKDSEVGCVILGPEQVDIVRSAVKKLTEEKKNEANIKFIALDVIKNFNKELPSSVGYFSDLIGEHVDETSLDSLRSCKVKPESVAFRPYSSGTTGLPKGVQLTHLNIVSNVLQMAVPEVDIQSEATDTYQEVIPCVVPFYHIYGTLIATTSLLHGSKMVVLPKFEQQSYLQILLNHKCTLLYLVPPLVSFIGTNPAIKKEMFQHVKCLMTGAAPLGNNVMEKCLQKMGKGSEFYFLQAYGMTEASTILHPLHNCTNPHTVGAPLSNSKVKVVHTTTGESLGPHQEGEICLKGPQVMKGYYNNPTATVSSIDRDGWFHTGDIGHYDKDSNFFIVDRLKELIKVKGFQVAPAELEDNLRTHPAVCDVCVVGIPNEKYGEVPIAYVVKSPSHPTVTSDLQKYVAAKVAPHKKLHDIVFVDEIPKSPAGKVLRKEIKKQYLGKTIKS